MHLIKNPKNFTLELKCGASVQFCMVVMAEVSCTCHAQKRALYLTEVKLGNASMQEQNKNISFMLIFQAVPFSELPLAAWIATVTRHFVFKTALWLFPLSQQWPAAELSIFLPARPTPVQKVTCQGEEGKSMHFKRPPSCLPQPEGDQQRVSELEH